MAEDFGKQDWVPRPDPTKLTTEQLFREVAALKEIVLTRLECAEESIDRIEEELKCHPEAIKEAIEHLKDMLGARMNGMDTLREEKFASFREQLKERDERFIFATQASREAIEKALLATKEQYAEQNRSSDLATIKSESSFTKQIDQLYTLIQSQAKANDDKFSDVKDRLTRIEGVTIGKTDTEKVHRDNTGLWIGFASAIIAFAALAIGAIGLFIANYHKV